MGLKNYVCIIGVTVETILVQLKLKKLILGDCYLSINKGLQLSQNSSELVCNCSSSRSKPFSYVTRTCENITPGTKRKNPP